MHQGLERLRQRKLVQWALAYLAAAFAAVQMLDLVGQRFGWPDSIERVSIVVAAIGFVVTLVLAWYHGERGAQRVTGTELAILALLLAIGGALLWRVVHMPSAGGVASSATAESHADPSTPPPDTKSIAVLPLANTSGDPANEYFSDGLSEELISVLARIPDLKIIGRNSSFRFKNTNDDSRTIGARLGVANLLEGSVRKQGDRVRIAVDLIAAADGHQLWADSYDRDLKDIFAVQSEIASAVVAQLKLKLLGAEAIHPAEPNPSVPAYTAMLKGKELLETFNEPNSRKAVGFFEEAIRLDPNYAFGYAQLSRAWRAIAALFTSDPDELADEYRRAREAAQTALKLAPDLSEAHSALAYVLLTGDLDLPGAEPEMRRAVELAPGNWRAVDGVGYLLAAQGRLTEAEATSRKAIALDPLSITPYLNIARIQIATNQLDEAEASLHKVLDIQHDASHAHAYLTTIDLLRHDSAAALRDAALEPEGFWRDYAQTLALQAQSDRAAADAALNALIAKYSIGGPFQIAIVYAYRKEPDRVFEWLDKAWDARDSGLTQLLVTPFLLDYRGDPRFAAVAAKLKIDAASRP